MKKFRFLIPIILILSIIGSFVGMVYNLKFKHDKLQGISQNQLPLYEANHMVVDEDGNYYIGDGLYNNNNIQIFDSKGNYVSTISFTGRSCNFSVDKNKLIAISLGSSKVGYETTSIEYIIDLDKMKIINENKIDRDKAEDLFVKYGQLTDKTYKTRDKIYELKRNFILYNKMNIINGNTTKTLVLKNMPIFPLPTPVYLGAIVLLFWSLCLYINIVLHFDKIKEKINSYKKIRSK